MKLSEIGNTLRDIRVVPVKTLGQNFLHDQNLARWMVAQADIGKDDFVLEIGPGLGAITEPVLASGAQVWAIEKDGRLVEYLRVHLPGDRLVISHGDAMEFDPGQLYPRGPVKLLGNLPYYISTQLLLRYLSRPSPISLAVLMLQKEVAARLSAGPRSKDYGILTLILKSQCHVEYLRTVPASVFLPQPDVDSAFVRVRPRSPNELPEYDRQLFIKLVRTGFSQRRKQLGKLLKNLVDDWSGAAAVIGVPITARAEELGLDEWIGLTNLIQPAHDPIAGNDPAELFAVVDENDSVTGAAPRAEVHGNNLRHRAVHILLFNVTGELLLQKRSRWKDRHPGVWDSSAAGHVGAGEAYDATAERELEEELGVTTPLTQLARLPASAETGWEFIALYRGLHDGPFAPAPSEIDLVRFFAPQVVAEWIKNRPGDFAPGFLECWRVYESQNAPG